MKASQKDELIIYDKYTKYNESSTTWLYVIRLLSQIH